MNKNDKVVKKFGRVLAGVVLAEAKMAANQRSWIFYEDKVPENIKKLLDIKVSV